MLLAAAACWVLSRGARDAPKVTTTYRTVASSGSRWASETRGYAILLLALWSLTQLVYIGVHLETVRWWLGAREPPRISPQLFFWVCLIEGSLVAGALYSAWTERPRPASESSEA